MEDDRICKVCGRFIEEDHKCSDVILDKEEEIFDIVKKEQQGEILAEIEKLEIKDGDILLFAYDPSLPQQVIEATVDQVNDFVQEYRKELVPIMVLPMTFDLQAMDKEGLIAFRDSAQQLIDDIEELEKVKTEKIQ